ncbi:hypothetical protein KFE25_001718 [Diacronema lutheri]|uniref:Uncharacterized protein n=1 Tax=Diacronema lutheri TaxID=2081491 RepID=A0A8J5XH54_DIALT|nr:hypothetical protein KFE25_001718 [Diacronema lutheri]
MQPLGTTSAEHGWHDRLRRCHYCAAYISASTELYLLDDSVYCCASHRARAAAVGKAVAQGWEPQEEQRSAFARRLPTSTGVGLAASHRSWWALDDLSDAGTCPSSASDDSVRSNAGTVLPSAT